MSMVLANGPVIDPKNVNSSAFWSAEIVTNWVFTPVASRAMEQFRGAVNLALIDSPTTAPSGTLMICVVASRAEVASDAPSMAGGAGVRNNCTPAAELLRAAISRSTICSTAAGVAATSLGYGREPTVSYSATTPVCVVVASRMVSSTAPVPASTTADTPLTPVTLDRIWPTAVAWPNWLKFTGP